MLLAQSEPRSRSVLQQVRLTLTMSVLSQVLQVTSTALVALHLGTMLYSIQQVLLLLQFLLIPLLMQQVMTELSQLFSVQTQEQSMRSTQPSLHQIRVLNTRPYSAHSTMQLRLIQMRSSLTAQIAVSCQMQSRTAQLLTTV